jgi:hypothetical protein
MDRNRYPTMDQVNLASRVQICTWYRFLPSPDDEHRPILERIIERFKELGGFTPEISKRVGWGDDRT